MKKVKIFEPPFAAMCRKLSKENRDLKDRIKCSLSENKDLIRRYKVVVEENNRLREQLKKAKGDAVFAIANDCGL